MIESLDVFPTRFYTSKISDKEVLQNIYDEIYSKKDKMRSISWATDHQNPDSYITDYECPVNIDSFLSAFEILKRELNQSGLDFDIDKYWTALYKKAAFHLMHTHSPAAITSQNYSGIFYISSVGSTNFFSNNPSSFLNEMSIPSESGRFVLFPSNLPHQVIFNVDSDEERCVISFNGTLKEV